MYQYPSLFRPIRPFIPWLAGLTAACLVVLLLAVSHQGAAAHGGATRYVDWATGSDDSDCTNSNDPCATIGYALGQSGSGDNVLVAQGSYSETITLSAAINLLGGYEATNWSRDIAGQPTVIDAGGADSLVVNITPGANAFLEGLMIQGANHVSDTGGGVFVNAASVVISATIIQENTAGNGGSGGGIWYEGQGVAVSLINASLLNNTAEGSGGAILGCCASGNATLMLDNVLVSGNSAGDRGGGLDIQEGSATIHGSTIVSNTATNFGGGLNLRPGVALTATNTGVLTNTAGSVGGGIAADNNTLFLEALTAAGNSAGNMGGGIALAQAAATMANSSVLDNEAGGPGGGVHLSGGSLEISGSQINDNTANGPSDINGGGIAAENNSVLSLHDSVLRGNRAIADDFSAANALVVNSSHLTATNTIIMDNRVGSSAISLFGPTTFALTNVLIAGNDGDGLASDEGPVSGIMMNLTIAGNSGFGIRLNPGTVNIVNSILWGNGGDDNGCGGCVSSYSDIGTGNTSGAGNISADPQFLDPANGDYHLSPGSPAIDAGTAANAPPDDLEGTPRDALPDMGAYEWNGFRIYLPIGLKT